MTSPETRDRRRASKPLAFVELRDGLRDAPAPSDRPHLPRLRRRLRPARSRCPVRGWVWPGKSMSRQRSATQLTANEGPVKRP